MVTMFIGKVTNIWITAAPSETAAMVETVTTEKGTVTTEYFDPPPKPPRHDPQKFWPGFGRWLP